MPGKGTLGARLARHRCPSLLAARVPIRSKDRGPHCPSVRGAEAGRRRPRPALFLVRTLVDFPERQPAAHDAEGMVCAGPVLPPRVPAGTRSCPGEGEGMPSSGLEQAAAHGTCEGKRDGALS